LQAFGLVSLPPLPEEVLEQAAAGFGQDALHDLDPVVVPRVIQELIEGTDRAGLGIAGAEGQRADPGVQAGSGAHGAGLQGGDQDRAGQAVVAQGPRRLAQSHDLRVGGGIVGAQRLIEAAAHDSPLERDHGADRHLPQTTCPRRLAQGFPHEVGEQVLFRMRIHEHGPSMTTMEKQLTSPNAVE
jgi:hypothetical protein